MQKDPKLAIFGAISIIVAASLWGLDSVVLTPKLFNLNLGLVVFLLHLIPFALMQVVLFKEYEKLNEFSISDWLYLSLIAIFGGAVGTLAIVKALYLVNFTALSVVVILQKLQPVFAIIMAAIILKEKIKKDFILWASIAIIAAYFVSFGFNLPNFKTGSNTIYAVLYALLAAFSFGSSTVFGKKILEKYSFPTVSFYRYGLTSILMFIYVLATAQLNLSGISKQNWLIFLIIAFTTGSGALFLYYWGLKKVKASAATIFELAFPISAIVFDYFINQTHLSIVQWLAILIMLAAITKISLLQD